MSTYDEWWSQLSDCDKHSQANINVEDHMPSRFDGRLEHKCDIDEMWDIAFDDATKLSDEWWNSLSETEKKELYNDYNDVF